MFANFLGVLEAVLMCGGKATAGEVQRYNPHMTIGQVKRAMNSLVAEGYLDAEKVKYGRTGKWVFVLSNRAKTNLCIVARRICGEA